MVQVQCPGGLVEGDDVAAQRAALGLALGVDVLPYAANLAAAAALATAADRLTYWTGASSAALAVLTAAGRALIDDADAAAQRATLGLTTIDPLSPMTTKGDLITRSATVAVRLGVGTDGQVLTADASIVGGLKWATPANARTGAASAAPATSQNDYNPSGLGTAAVLEVNPSASLQITGLQAGSAGDRLTLVNSSTDYLLVLPHESGSSSASNRIASPQVGAAASFVLPGDCLQLVYSGSRWRVVARSQPWLAWDDCFGDPNSANGEIPFNSSNGGGFSTIDPPGLADVAVGVVDCQTGTNSNGFAAVVANSGFRAFENKHGCALALARVAVPTLSDGTETFQVYSGFVNVIGSDAEDALAWLYRAGSGGTNDVHWRYSKCVGGSETATASALTVSAGDFVWLGVFANADWTRADYFYSADGATWTFAGSLTSLPAADSRMSVGATIRKLAGTTSRSLYADCVGLRYDAARG